MFCLQKVEKRGKNAHLLTNEINDFFIQEAFFMKKR